MSTYEFENPQNSTVLFELEEHLDFFIKLYQTKKFPKILMLSGDKGVGKFTLINHFLNFIFDDQYNPQKKIIKKDSTVYKEYLNNIFPNIIYLQGSSYKNIKIDDIRSLKSTLMKSTLLKKDRFIVLDDVELFNVNSLNALLKIIEEPKSNDFFILINNKTKSLLKTIYSRSIEIKILLANKVRLNIINSLIKKNNLKVLIDYESFYLTPGNFLSFNNICEENEIDLNDYFISNLETLLNLYKKKKSMNIINFILFLTDIHFQKIKEMKNYNIDKISEDKSYIIDNINKLVTFNLNNNALINAIKEKLSDE